MEAYSSWDLLGINKKKDRNINQTFVQKIKHFVLQKETKNLYFRLRIPHLVYYRTKRYCHFLKKHYGIHFEVNHFVLAIYNHYVTNYFLNYNHQEIYKLLLRTENQEGSAYEIIDYSTNTKYKITNREEDVLEIGCILKRDIAYDGEIIVYEIDRIYGYKTTLEKLVETLWIHSIEKSKRISTKKMVQYIQKLLMEYDDKW